MIFKSSNPKVRPKLLIFLLALFISITITTILQTQAEESGYNGSQGNGGAGASMTLTGGPSESKTAILFYIVDKQTGTPKTQIGIITPESVAWIKAKFVQSKLGRLNYTSAYIATNLPKPVTWSGSAWSPNGNAVKAWLLAEGQGAAAGMKRWEAIVETLFGENVLEEILENQANYSIVVEPVAWMNTYYCNAGTYLIDNPPISYSVSLATATGWAKFYASINQPTGDSYTQKMTHQALPYSMVLEKERFGLAPHAGETMTRLNSSSIISSGYGIHIIDLEDDAIHTFYELTPGPPEPNDTHPGTCNIVKGYYEENLDTGVKTSDGVFTTELCTNNVIIDSEVGYEIEDL